MVLLAEINHLRKESKENLAYLSILLCSLCLSPLYTNIMQQKSIVNKQSTCFRLALKWTRHRRTKEIITQRVTLEERDKTRVTFTTYFLLLNPHSLRQVEVTAGQKSTIILAVRCFRSQIVQTFSETRLHPKIVSGKRWSMLQDNGFFSQSAVWGTRGKDDPRTSR